MFNLLKKDLIACFKIDLKTIVTLISGFILISTVLMPLLVFTYFSAATLTFFVSYIFIFRSFYLDDVNKGDYFFNSLPIEKEDIVYSKYLFATIIITSSLIISYFYSNIIKSIWGYSYFNMDVVLITLILILLLISLCFPLIFKYGYRKSYIVLNLIIAVIVVWGIYWPKTGSIAIAEWETPSLLMDKTLITKFIISLLIYIISMYISKRIYYKKEVAE